jgi:hypothetical protein
LLVLESYVNAAVIRLNAIVEHLSLSKRLAPAGRVKVRQVVLQVVAYGARRMIAVLRGRKSEFADGNVEKESGSEGSLERG